MPKAEVGSTKYLANKMKAKGLQRLRWYCQICGKQCRDENGFKQHTLSEGHVRAMLLVGEDPKKYINDFSNQFRRDFLQLLKTAHGEKKVHLNNFYQEYIRDKEHVHMNATKWPSLTEFAKYLGSEGICRVEEGERGLEIQWVDDSPEAIRRREDVKRKEKLAKGDEDLEAKLLERQIKAARKEAERNKKLASQREVKIDEVDGEKAETGPVKVSLSLGGKLAQKNANNVIKPVEADAPVVISTFAYSDDAAGVQSEARNSGPEGACSNAEDEGNSKPIQSTTTPKVSMSLAAGKSKLSNPLMAKGNPLAKKKTTFMPAPEKKMSNAERIMREEMERKQLADQQRGLHGGGKRQRIG